LLTTTYRHSQEFVLGGSPKFGAEGRECGEPHQLGCLGEHCKLPQRGSEQSPDRRCILDAPRVKEMHLMAAKCRFVLLCNSYLIMYLKFSTRNYSIARKRGHWPASADISLPHLTLPWCSVNIRFLGVLRLLLPLA